MRISVDYEGIVARCGRVSAVSPQVGCRETVHKVVGFKNCWDELLARCIWSCTVVVIADYKIALAVDVEKTILKCLEENDRNPVTL
jgi:hypothetical protein